MSKNTIGASGKGKKKGKRTLKSVREGKGKVRIRGEKSELQRKLVKRRIESECNSYKKELRELMEKDDFRAGFKSDKEWKDCKRYYNGVIDGISADTLIDSYCMSDEKSRTEVKNDFAKRSTKNKIRKDSSRPFQWPTCSEDYYYENKTKGNKSKLRGKGANFDIHHIIPKSSGGGNDISNTIPMHAKYHFDSQGIHTPEGHLSHLGSLLETYVAP